MRSAGAGLVAGCLHTLSGPDHLAVRSACASSVQLLSPWHVPTSRPSLARPCCLAKLAPVAPALGTAVAAELILGLPWAAPQATRLRWAAGADAVDDWAEPREGRAAGRAVGLRPQHRPAAAGPADGGAEGARLNFIVKEREHKRKRPSFAAALRAQLRARHCRRQAAAERMRAVRHACALHVALEH